MFGIAARISSLFLGIGVLLAGMGLLGTLVAVRGRAEHFSDLSIGLVMSAYFLGFVVGPFVCPALIRRAGHIRVFAALAAVTSAVAVLHALVVHPVAWWLLRVVNGVCIVGLYMIMESWLNVLAPNETRGKVMALYTTLTLLAMGGGQFLIVAGEITGFVPFGLAAVLLSLALVPVALTRVPEPVPVAAPHVSLGTLYRDSPLGVAGAVVGGLVNGGFWGLGPVFAGKLGMDEGGVAVFMAATILGGALLQWPVGHLSDRYDRRTVLVLVCFGGAALALAALATARGAPALLPLPAFLYGGLAFTVYSLSVSHVNDFVPPDHALEAARGLLLVYGVAAVAGPTAAGLLMSRLGPGTLLVYFAANLALLGVFALYRMARRAPVPVAEQVAFVPMLRTSQAAIELDPRVESEAGPEKEPAT